MPSAQFQGVNTALNMPLNNLHRLGHDGCRPLLDVRSITLPEKTDNPKPIFDTYKYVSPEFLAGVVDALKSLSSKELLQHLDKVVALMMLIPNPEETEIFLQKISWPELLTHLTKDVIVDDFEMDNDLNRYERTLQLMAWLYPLELKKYLADNWDVIIKQIPHAGYSSLFLITLKMCWPEKLLEFNPEVAWKQAFDDYAGLKAFDYEDALEEYARMKILWPQRMRGFELEEDVLRTVDEDFQKWGMSEDISVSVAGVHLLNYDAIQVINGRVKLIKKPAAAVLAPDVPRQPASLEM